MANWTSPVFLRSRALLAPGPFGIIRLGVYLIERSISIWDFTLNDFNWLSSKSRKANCVRNGELFMCLMWFPHKFSDFRSSKDRFYLSLNCSNSIFTFDPLANLTLFHTLTSLASLRRGSSMKGKCDKASSSSPRGLKSLIRGKSRHRWNLASSFMRRSTWRQLEVWGEVNLFSFSQ